MSETQGMYFGLNQKILISCCNLNGGLFELTIKDDSVHLERILHDNLRGMAKFQDQIVLVSGVEVLILDNEYRVVKRKASDRSADYHGVGVYKDKAFIVETDQNRVGIYDLSDLSRVDEIKLSPEEIDVNHVNDLFIKDNKLYISMFADTGHGLWRNLPLNSGVIVEYCLKTNNRIGICLHSLHQPHSPLFIMMYYIIVIPQNFK
ncbi:hypothetical protein [Cohnella luojiensis]|uniref:DUF4915 domain-containing protein n=1 Tax=Cohnella luojiensis TaxID=652876 RepID=A0A4Y8LY29_9BACL|nr:hypothetical protein [Cohnella luojiensis]TFE27172.1 hypothetical protein E2980_09715 [Cohnella luojiensis]